MIITAPGPSQWDAFDRARKKAGGAWSNANTLRIAVGKPRVSGDEQTIYEVTVVGGRVRGVRILQDAPNTETLEHPRLTANLSEMLNWYFSMWDGPTGRMAWVYITGGWGGVQTSITCLHRAFIGKR